MFKGLFSKGGSTTDDAPAPERDDAPKSRGYTVGWFLQTDRTSMIYDSPKPVRTPDRNTTAVSRSMLPGI